MNSHLKRLENCQGLIDLTGYPNVMLISYPKFCLSTIGSEIVLVALTDKFNALFHHGNFPVG